ncbi:uncharacterized protein LOC114363083 [Ostrinia furnacalis]|uniref:uncharacterized protein LOC114363083 n=1 Tax=Ostrinia furnacalis TaxID=93504 RepID=UPI00103C815C|nr:uncharacterized protein LOC114363083 [Ostrinia furnacalis]
MGSIHSTKIQRFHRHFRYGVHLIECEVDARAARPMRIAVHAPLSYQVYPPLSFQVYPPLSYQVYPAISQAPPSPTADKCQRFPRVTSEPSRRRFFVGLVAKFLDSFFNNLT